MLKKLTIIMLIVWPMLFFAGCGAIAVQTGCGCDCEYCNCDHDWEEDERYYEPDEYEGWSD